MLQYSVSVAFTYPPIKMSGFDERKCQAFVDETNTEYARVHSLFEAQFWGTKMALTGVPKGSVWVKTSWGMPRAPAPPSH